MRNHSDIVKAAGEIEQIAERHGVSIHTVRSWIRRNGIPTEHWPAFISDGVTTCDELLSGVKPRGERVG